MKMLHCRGRIAEWFKSRVHFLTIRIEVNLFIPSLFDYKNAGWGLLQLAGAANQRPLSASVLSYRTISGESTVFFIYLLNSD
jgi:hypothetical protein